MTRRDYKSPPPTTEEVHSRAPWRSAVVPGITPLVLLLGPGRSVRLTGRELALHAGLEVDRDASRGPQEGDLCGAVLLSTVQGSALSGGRYCGADRLRAHQLSSLLIDAEGEVTFWATNRDGEVSLWPCVAVAAPIEAQRVPYVFPEGPVGDMLRTASLLE